MVQIDPNSLNKFFFTATRILTFDLQGWEETKHVNKTTSNAGLPKYPVLKIRGHLTFKRKCVYAHFECCGFLLQQNDLTFCSDKTKNGFILYLPKILIFKLGFILSIQ